MKDSIFRFDIPIQEISCTFGSPPPLWGMPILLPAIGMQTSPNIFPSHSTSFVIVIDAHVAPDTYCGGMQTSSNIFPSHSMNFVIVIDAHVAPNRYCRGPYIAPTTISHHIPPQLASSRVLSIAPKTIAFIPLNISQKRPQLTSIHEGFHFQV